MKYIRNLILWLILAATPHILFAADLPQGRTDTVHNAAQLDSAVKYSGDTLDLYLMPGDYHLSPKQDVDTAIRVFDNDSMTVPFTYGLRISAGHVRIRGAQAYSSVIYTHAGYGLYFLNCKDAVIEGLIITGGERDSNPNAPDAAIVVKNSRVKIMNNLIFENFGDSALLKCTTKGIMGVCVREGGYAFIYNNQIAHNTWHGIGVFRDAEATITGNLIDGVDKVDDGTFGGGAGMGILVTRNGKAILESNVVKRYCKGIGIFNAADVKASNNLIEDIAVWGVAVWDADTSRPVARLENNIIYKTGACGMSITRYLEGGEPGYCKHNLFVETGQDRRFDSPDKYCAQCALAVQGRPDNFDIKDNTFYKNVWLAPCFTSLDLGVADFIETLQTQYSSLPLQWYSGYSEFIQRFFLYASR